MRLIDADLLWERACELEEEARIHLNKFGRNDGLFNIEWNVWSAILNERTAFKHDVFDAPTIDINQWIPCSERLPKESERDFIVSVAKKYRWLGYSVIMIHESSVLINGYKDGFYDAWKKAPKPYEVKEQ